MKNLTIALLLLPAALISQTVKTEEDYLNKAITSMKWDQAQASTRAKQWAKLKLNYPAFPYDTLKREVVVEQVVSLPGITKAQMHKRVKEWGALNFGKLDAVLEYEDMETGKIIFEGYTEVLHYELWPTFWGNDRIPSKSDLYFSMVIAMKDGKAKVHFENMEFRHWVRGYSAGSFYVPGETVKSGLNSFFPIVSNPPDTWEVKMDLINTAVKILQLNASDLGRFILHYDDEYKF